MLFQMDPVVLVLRLLTLSFLTSHMSHAQKMAADAALERTRENPDDHGYDERASYTYAFKTHVILYDKQVLLQF